MARAVTSAQTALGRAVHIMRVRREIALSRAAGPGKDAAGGIERGAVDPTYATFRVLAEALRVGLVELIERRTLRPARSCAGIPTMWRARAGWRSRGCGWPT